MWIIDAGLLPDAVIRWGIRRLVAERSRELAALRDDPQALDRYVTQLRESPVAVHTDDANAQHYEVPASFYAEVLGPYRKYSCGYWPEGCDSLEASERAALELTCERAGLADGQRILELGCGWGSLTLFMAERYPGAEITAISNSSSQRAYIEGQAAERGLTNLRVVTVDVNAFEPEGRFDRVVSVEMFEHVRNYGELLQRIAGWLEPEGRLFIHIFTHKDVPYLYEDRGPGDWMARHFFTGGQMPTAGLFERFSDDLEVCETWTWDGTHYQRTSEAWLAAMDAAEAKIRPIFAEVYGAEAKAFWHRWRVFFLACAEMFGWRGGQEWGVTHLLFAPAAVTAQA